MQEMDKKFVESLKLEDYEILTDDGFKDVSFLHKTIKYDVYNLILKNKELKCADRHILFLKDNSEIFVKDLKIGDFVKTVDGLEEVLNVQKMNYKKNMWDFELTNNNVKYYTNGILSHNTTYLRKLISLLSEDKLIIFVPAYMLHDISTPQFMSFISNFKDSILILEDSEFLLKADERTMAISNILNITDGLLGDYMETQIICTFNVKVGEIDEALTRAGRLHVNYEFKKLSVDEANLLSEKLGKDNRYDDETSLAEIYEGLNQIVNITERKRIGFGN